MRASCACEGLLLLAFRRPISAAGVQRVVLPLRGRAANGFCIIRANTVAVLTTTSDLTKRLPLSWSGDSLVPHLGAVARCRTRAPALALYHSHTHSHERDSGPPLLNISGALHRRIGRTRIAALPLLPSA